MDKRKPFVKLTGYERPQKRYWVGRKSSNPLPQYYWQAVNLLDLEAKEPGTATEFTPAFIGYCCDEGVKRNKGRQGAKAGPQNIRRKLARLALPHKELIFSDVGDLHCIEGDMEVCQISLGKTVSWLLKKNYFPIVLGGGHDVAFGSFIGINDFLKDKSEHPIKLGIINFDAHFDLRVPKPETHSGTPFYQMAMHLDDGNNPFYYLVVGIQESANSLELFETARKLNVEYITAESIFLQTIDRQKKTIEKFLKEVNWVYVSIDLDVFSTALGVSAPSPFGIQPYHCIELLKTIIDSKKLKLLEIAEMNPIYDTNEITTHIAAGVINAFLRYISYSAYTRNLR